MSEELTPGAAAVASLRDTLSKTIAEGRLEMYRKIVEEVAAAGPHEMADIAAAALRLAAARKPAAPAPPAKRSAPASGVRLTMQVGRRDGIRPGDVVGSIANEAGIAGRDIGPIDIREEVTYVTVPADAVESVLEKTAQAKFRGRRVHLRVAEEGEGGERPPRRFDDRGPRRDQPRFTDRDRPREPRRSERQFGNRAPRHAGGRPEAPRGGSPFGEGRLGEARRRESGQQSEAPRSGPRFSRGRDEGRGGPHASRPGGQRSEAPRGGPRFGQRRDQPGGARPPQRRNDRGGSKPPGRGSRPPKGRR